MSGKMPLVVNQRAAPLLSDLLTNQHKILVIELRKVRQAEQELALACRLALFPPAGRLELVPPPLAAG